MAQPVSKILNADEMSHADYRKKFVGSTTHPNDFVSADQSLVLSTVPFLPAGDAFVDIPLFPIGLCQQFSVSEGLNGQFIPEVGSTRKVNAAGTAAGSGNITRLEYFGNSLSAVLYRPTFYFMAAVPELADLSSKIFASTNSNDWLKSICSPDLDLYSLDLSAAMDRVIGDGGLNGLLYKLPFGLIEVKMDARQRVTKINFYEQCALRGQSGGMSAAQFQIADNLSFEFERKRPLLTAGIFSLSTDNSQGLQEKANG